MYGLCHRAGESCFRHLMYRSLPQQLSRKYLVAHPISIMLRQQVLRASAGVTGAGTQLIDGDKEESGYRTFLGHLFDLLEEKINTDRYEESVRQLVGNLVRRHALPSSYPKLGDGYVLSPCAPSTPPLPPRTGGLGGSLREAIATRFSRENFSQFLCWRCRQVKTLGNIMFCAGCEGLTCNRVSRLCALSCVASDAPVFRLGTWRPPWERTLCLSYLCRLLSVDVFACLSFSGLRVVQCGQACAGPAAEPVPREHRQGIPQAHSALLLREDDSERRGFTCHLQASRSGPLASLGERGVKPVLGPVSWVFPSHLFIAPTKEFA